MKKIISFLLVSILIFMLSGCSSKPKTALIISGTPINEEIYNYFLDQVSDRPNDYNLSENPAKDEIQDAAIKLCIKYLAINTDFSDRKLSLSTAEKISISEEVNNYWIRFSSHYKKIGISRQTLNKIITSEAYEDAIFNSIYDQGVTNAEEEKVLTSYFYENYTAFRSVCAYFTNDSGEKMSTVEKNDVIAKIENMESASGKSSDQFTKISEANGYTASDVVIIEKNSDGYPSGFFEKVYAQSNDTVSIYTYDECIFAVRKESLKELGEEVYSSYRSICIEKIYSSDWNDYINNYAEKFTVEEIKV